MNLIGFKREPGGGFYLRLQGSCRLLSHSSAILQPQVPMATGQGISIRASAPYNHLNRRDLRCPCCPRNRCNSRLRLISQYPGCPCRTRYPCCSSYNTRVPTTPAAPTPPTTPTSTAASAATTFALLLQLLLSPSSLLDLLPLLLHLYRPCAS
jgi:hypothetical protein